MNRSVVSLIWFVLVALLAGHVSATAAEWEFADEDDGVKSWRKNEPNSKVTGFAGEVIIDASVAKIAWVIRDNEHRTKWVDRLKHSRVLEIRGPRERIIYQHFGLPWPIADRDYVYSAKMAWEGEKLAFNLESTTSEKSPKTKGVRAQLTRCIYHLTPVSDTRTHVRVEVHTDPKGKLPSWLVNLIQKSWPIKTLKGIRRMTKEPYAKLAELPPKTP